MGSHSFSFIIGKKQNGRLLPFYLLLILTVLILLVWLLSAAQTAASEPGTTLIVNTADDDDDGACDAAHCSLREAINMANGLPGPDTIQFSIPTTPPIEVTQNIQLPVIEDTLTILGDGVTVAGDRRTVFEIETGTAVTMTRLTIRNGITKQFGAGIFNKGELTLIESVITQNYASYSGEAGGIYNAASGVLHLIRSTMSLNTADYTAGGIWNASGVVIIDNSTLSDNQSAFGVGGIWSRGGTVVINQSTLVDNDGLEGPTDLYNQGTLYLSNSIFETGCDNDGDILLSVAIIAWNGGCGATFSGDPHLGPRNNYGGPTQTHPLFAGSQAIDNADPAYCPETDQRGVSRPDGAGCDIGSFEGFYSPTAVSLTGFGEGKSYSGWVWIVGVVSAVLLAALIYRQQR